MAHATLSYVALTSIEPNPFRDLKNYPFDKRKLEALERSIDDVGLWEGMIGRREGRGYQLAFGHHRWEAARKAKLTTVPLIVRDLTDEQMVGFMGRENMEDFNSDFLVQLNAWDAALRLLVGGNPPKVPQTIEVARVLGWTIEPTVLNDTAKACSAAHKLIEGGYLAREDLRNTNVDAARRIVGRTADRIEMLDKLGKMGSRPAAEIEREKKRVGAASKTVAKGVREGTISQKNIRSEIDRSAVKSAAAKGKVSPLLAAFAKEVADSIHKMLMSDNTSAKLSEIEKILPRVELEEDHAALRRIDFALAEHGETTATWRSRLSPKGRRVIPFKLLKREVS